MPILLEEAVRAIAKLIATNNIIKALALYRKLTGNNLEAAKIFVEELRLNPNLAQIAQAFDEWQVPASTPQSRAFLLEYVIHIN